jgi:hypothetical protein
MTREQSAFDYDEFLALRSEIELRIILQNISLMILYVVFVTLGTIQLLIQNMRFEIAVVFVVTVGIISLIWTHHGARTLQIKTYLAYVLEPRLRNGAGWEVWHARHRVQGVLGSRWFISTKGVFVGSQLVMIAEAWLLTPPATLLAKISLGLAVAGTVVTAALLRKPQLSQEAYVTEASIAGVEGSVA